jgi:hypothetical protein
MEAADAEADRSSADASQSSGSVGCSWSVECGAEPSDGNDEHDDRLTPRELTDAEEGLRCSLQLAGTTRMDAQGSEAQHSRAIQEALLVGPADGSVGSVDRFLKQIFDFDMAATSVISASSVPEVD